MKKINITKKFLIREYIKNKKSSYQIAKEVGCNFTTILNYLKKYNIPIRTKSEVKKGKFGKDSSAYVDGRTNKQYFCIDCGKEIWYRAWKYGTKRCPSCASKKIWQNKERRKKLGKRMKFQWQNCKFREKTLKASFEARKASPNKCEKKLNKLLLKAYKFVGDGKLIVGGFCPDFVNKDNNKIIEMYGDYWHKKIEVIKRDKRRLIAYKKANYKTLIIWEHELKDLNRVKSKINCFNKI